MIVAIKTAVRHGKTVAFLVVCTGIVCTGAASNSWAQDYSILEKPNTPAPQQQQSNSGILPAPEVIPVPAPLETPLKPAAAQASEPAPVVAPAATPVVPLRAPTPPRPATQENRAKPSVPPPAPKPIAPATSGARGWPNSSAAKAETSLRSPGPFAVPGVLILGTRFGRGIAIPLPPGPMNPPVVRIPPIGIGPPALPAALGVRPPLPPRPFGPFGGRFRR